jgi:hypothetical protein
MAYTQPTVSDFKAYFTRDFPYGTTQDMVLDSDITKSIAEAQFNINEGLFADQSEYLMGFMYLTAHFLVMDLRAASQGISGSYSWMTTSKSVGSVSEGIEVPDFIKNNPTIFMYSKTPYGAKYINLLIPRIIGNMFSVFGNTKP